MILNFDGVSIVTGATCGDACWHAHEDICRCSCGGRNHGILNRGGTSPRRTSRAEQNMYELVAVIPGRAEGECWNDVEKRIRAAINAVTEERFPGLDYYAYGEYRPGGMHRPVIDRKISESQKKWPEVAAVPNACRLVWAFPAGTPYEKRNDRATRMQTA